MGLVAPRGIIAASVAGYFGLVLLSQGNPEGFTLEVLVFIIIIGTVTWAGLFARPLAWLLGIGRSNPPGVLIISAGPLARGIAGVLKQESVPVMLVDRSWKQVYKAREEGIEAYGGNALNPDFLESLGLEDTGVFWALTANDEVNTLASQVGRRLLGAGRTFQAHGEAAGSVAEHFSESAGEHLFGETFSVVRADARLRGGDVEVAAIDKEKEIPLPESFEPLFTVVDGRTKLFEGDEMPESGRFVGLMRKEDGAS